MTAAKELLEHAAREEGRMPDEVIATAVAFYATIPLRVRQIFIEALRGGDTIPEQLPRELVRALAGFELERRFDATRAAVAAGEIPPLPELTEEEAGAEAEDSRV